MSGGGSGGSACELLCYDVSGGKCYKIEVSMKECTYPDPATSQQATGDGPAPQLLDPRWREKSVYSSVVCKTPQDYFAGLKSKLGRTPSGSAEDLEMEEFSSATWAFAQAEIYNASHPDLFNQDWHVKLRRWEAEDVDLTFFGVDVDSVIPSFVKKLFDRVLEEVIVH